MIKEFKYSTFTKIKSISITVSLIGVILLLLILMTSSDMPSQGIYIIFCILVSLLVAKYEGSSHRNSKLTIDDEKIHMYRNKANVITDVKIRYGDIILIKLDKKVNILNLSVKKIFIVTEFRKIDIDISCYDSYKELLELIIKQTEDNEKVYIDKKVLELLM